MNIHFSSQRLDWKTPKVVYQTLNAEFKFDLDPCPAKLSQWGLFPDWDGLKNDWGKCNFVNPPYGRELPKWIKKGYEEYQKGKTVVFLVPSRTDTRWWHDYCIKATEIRFIKGRLKFDDQKNSAPFPSAIIIFNQIEQKNKGWHKESFEKGYEYGLRDMDEIKKKHKQELYEIFMNPEQYYFVQEVKNLCAHELFILKNKLEEQYLPFTSKPIKEINNLIKKWRNSCG